MSKQKQNLNQAKQMEEILAQMAAMRAELDTLKGRAQNRTPELTIPSEPNPVPSIQPNSPTNAAPQITTTRRKTLKRLGFALIGGAVAAVSDFSATQAKVIVSPTLGTSTIKAGAIIVPPGAQPPLNNPPNINGLSYGLVASGSLNALDFSTIGASVGVYGTSAGTGVRGYSSIGSGVFGETNSGLGVYGTSGTSNGVEGDSTSGNGVYGETSGSAGKGVYGKNLSTNTSSDAVYGETVKGRGVHGKSTDGPGVFGESTGTYGVYGKTSSTNGYGVYGESPSGTSGLLGGAAVTGNGVPNATGVYGFSSTGYGVYGYSEKSYAVHGYTDTGYACYFIGRSKVAGNLEVSGTQPYGGNITASGTITGMSKTFKIDHPLDPANKYLYHTSVESPDMKNIYDGLVTLDAQGEATVTMPDWFEALNTNFRYQLTCLDQYAPVYIAARIKDRQFKIAGGLPGQEISWMVTGIRQDAFADAYRNPVEQDKTGDEKGKYMRPELFS